MTLPNAPVERILRKAGADRISEDAVDELREAVEETGEEISRQAIKMADHAGRNTVQKADIEQAKR